VRSFLDPTGPVVAVITALGICVLNAVAGYFIAKAAFGKDLKVFLGVVFGSMAARLLVAIVLMWVFLGVVGMHQVAFAVTFAIASFLSVMGEALFFHFWHDRYRRRRLPVTHLLKKKDDAVMTAAFAL
jgi:hypothetical protein